MNAITQEEIAATVVAPHFEGVRDVFLSFSPEPDLRLQKLKKIKFVIDESMHDTPRHFAATRDDGLLMLFAPEIVDLDVETLVAIIAHEFGHALDFLYPARFYMPADGPAEATWIVERDLDTRAFRTWSKIWDKRNRDQIEWAADGIAEFMTGKHITYCGPCILQCFSGGIERPKGLR
jgi:hypothetical protein